MLLLMTYLQELHARGLAHAEHMTLLFSAYVKTSGVVRPDAFVMSEGHVFCGEGQRGERPFALDTVIRVCRQAGFFAHAAYLARQWAQHDVYLRVLVEDVGGSNVKLRSGSGRVSRGSRNEGDTWSGKAGGLARVLNPWLTRVSLLID